jgi:hypothetical protein
MSARSAKAIGYGAVRGALLVALGLVGVSLAGPVEAGVASTGPIGYHVYSCRTPSGGSAGADGWSEAKSDAYDAVLNTCPTGGLIAALRGGHAYTTGSDAATWMFNAPVGETITGATVWRAGETAGGQGENTSYLFWLSGGGATPYVFDECTAAIGCDREGNLSNPVDAQNRVEIPTPALTATHLELTASCGSPFEHFKCAAMEGSGYASVVELFAADITLTQATAPAVGAVEGGLASLPTVGGASDVGFDATDTGSGVYEAVFQVDGQVLQRQVLDENGGRCRDVGQTSDGLPAFLYVQPCPASVSVDVPFDTTPLTNGQHHLVVSVTDAAGNSTPVLDREIVVANAVSLAQASEPAGGRGLGNGTDPSERATLTARWKSTTKARLVGAYGEARTIEGRVTGSDGTAIADAALDVTVTPTSAGARPISLPSPRTDSDGRWSLHLPRGLSSCSLLIGYRSHLGDAQPVATRALALGVGADVVLHVTPRTVSAGQSIAFSGRLLGGAIPSGGKQVLLEARSPGSGWVEFHVARANAKGRFEYSYRFRYPGPVAYEFRAVCEHEADYPFLAGVSSVVRVLER